MKKYLSVLIVLGLLCSALVGVAEEERLDTWLTDELTTLTIATHSGWDNVKPMPSNDLPVWQEMERLTNVHIEWQVYPVDTYVEVMNVRLAAGKDLPDIWVDNSGKTGAELVEDGIIIDQTELWESCYPYTQAFFQQERYAGYQSFMFQDGHFYGVGNITASTGQTYGLMINQEWLKKLGLEMPTTTEELYNVLVAFRDKDPNGNGEKDETPMVCEEYTLWVMANYFGLEYGGLAGGYKHTTEGMRAEFVQPAYKEFLTYMNTLYAEKLLDQDYASCTFDKIQEYAANDRCGVVAWWIQAAPTLSGYSPYSGEENNMDVPVFVPVQTLNEDNGGVIYYRLGYGGDNMRITTACKNPELAARWIDFSYCSPESLSLIAYGVEGITYTVNENGEKEFIGDRITWTTKRDEIGGSQQPRAWIQTDEMMDTTYFEWWTEIHDRFTYTMPTVYNLTFTPDERDLMSENAADLDTYVNECRTNFMLGTLSLDQFDEYVDRCYELGLETMLQVYESAWERTFQ